MSARIGLRRVLALRALIEEREEANLQQCKQAEQACAEALDALRLEARDAITRMHQAFALGQTAEDAGLFLSLSPVRERVLQLEQQASAEASQIAEASWMGARLERQQLETAVTAAEDRRSIAKLRAEQKSLDSWYLSKRSRQEHRQQDAGDSESTPRIDTRKPSEAGPGHA